MAALGKHRQRAQQLADLLGVRRVAEDRQAEGGLGDEDVAFPRAVFRLEGGAGGVAPALVVAGRPKVASVTKTSQGTGSNTAQVASGRRL
jgi:hypothetical protein